MAINRMIQIDNTSIFHSINREEYKIELLGRDEVRLDVEVHVGVRRAQEHSRNRQAVVTIVSVR